MACLLLLSLSHPLSRLENTGILLSREHWNTRLILCFCYDNGFVFCQCVNCMWYRSRLYRCVATLKCLHFLHGNLNSNGIQNGKAAVAKCVDNLHVFITATPQTELQAPFASLVVIAFRGHIKRRRPVVASRCHSGRFGSPLKSWFSNSVNTRPWMSGFSL